jgi:hypothetical protein
LVGRKLKTPIPVVLLGNKVFLLLLFVWRFVERFIKR